MQKRTKLAASFSAMAISAGLGVTVFEQFAVAATFDSTAWQTFLAAQKTAQQGTQQTRIQQTHTDILDHTDVTGHTNNHTDTPASHTNTTPVPHQDTTNHSNDHRDVERDDGSHSDRDGHDNSQHTNNHSNSSVQHVDYNHNNVAGVHTNQSLGQHSNYPSHSNNHRDIERDDGGHSDNGAHDNSYHTNTNHSNSATPHTNATAGVLHTNKPTHSNEYPGHTDNQVHTNEAHNDVVGTHTNDMGHIDNPYAGHTDRDNAEAEHTDRYNHANGPNHTDQTTPHSNFMHTNNSVPHTDTTTAHSNDPGEHWDDVDNGVHSHEKEGHTNTGGHNNTGGTHTNTGLHTNNKAHTNQYAGHNNTGVDHDNYVPSPPVFFDLTDNKVVGGMLRIGLYSYDKNADGAGTQDAISKTVRYDIMVRRIKSADGSASVSEWRTLAADTAELAGGGLLVDLNTADPLGEGGGNHDGTYELKAVARNASLTDAAGTVTTYQSQERTITFQARQNTSPSVAVTNGKEFINFTFGFNGALTPSGTTKSYGSGFYEDSTAQDGLYVKVQMSDPDTAAETSQNWQKAKVYLKNAGGILAGTTTDVIWSDTGTSVTSSQNGLKTGYAYLSKTVLMNAGTLTDAQVVVETTDYKDAACTQVISTVITSQALVNGTATNMTVNVDSTRPIVSASHQDYTWKNTDVNVALTYSDGQSGIAVQEYQITQSSTQPVSGWIPYTGPLTINNDGQFYLWFHAQDKVGNEQVGVFGPYKVDKTAPAGTITQTSPVDSQRVLTLTATDMGSGVKRITLPDNTTVTGSTASYTTATSGSYQFIVEDNAGNTKTISTVVDMTPPTVTSDKISSAWTNQNIVVNLTYADATSGVAVAEYQVTQDGTNRPTSWKSYQGPITISEEGYNYVWYHAKDNQGNEVYGKFGSFPIDRQAPTATHTLTPSTGRVVINVTATDTLSGTLTIKTPGSTYSGGSAQYTAMASGTYNFELKDYAGNIATYSVYVDMDLPTVTADNTSSAWTQGTTINLSYADAGSGIKSKEYQVTASTVQPTTGWQPYTGAVTIANEGVSYLWYRATDNRNNALTGYFGPYNVDKTAPAATATQTRLSGTQVRIDLTATDSISGVKSIKLPDNVTVVNGATASYTAPRAGLYSFVITDNAGNTYTHNVTVADVIPPTVTANNTDYSWKRMRVDVALTYADSESSVVVKQYQITNSAAQPTSGWQNYTGLISLTSEGSNYLWYRAVDAAGNEAVGFFGPYLVDMSGPYVVINDSYVQWRKDTPRITITATDSVSGIMATEYQVTTSSTQPTTGWLPYTTAVAIPEGQYHFWYRVTDNAENATCWYVGPFKVDQTAPTATTSVTLTSEGQATISVMASDDASGVKRIKLPDNSYVNAATATYAVTATGSYTFTIEDNAGNTATVSVPVDLTKPTVTTNNTDYTWKNADISVPLTFNDASGMALSEYAVSNQNATKPTSGWMAYTAPVNLTIDGQYYVWYHGKDTVGNEVYGSFGPYKLDKTSPAATATQTRLTGTQIKIEITATDSGSGVQLITLPDHTVIMSANASYTAPSAGSYTFVITDHAGNAFSYVATVADVTAPTVTTDKTDYTWGNADITVHLTYADSESVVSVKQFQVTESAQQPTTGWVDYTGPITISHNGANYLWYRAVDAAGNEAIGCYGPYLLDKSAPIITAQQTRNTITVTASDTGSTVKRINLPDGTYVQGDTIEYPITTDGPYTFEVEDDAGNISSITVHADLTAPTAVSSNTDYGWKNAPISVDLSFADQGSGIESQEYQITTSTAEPTTGWLPYTDSLNLSNDGIYYVWYRAVDKVGNVAVGFFGPYKLDLIAPSAAVTQTRLSGTQVRLDASATDSGSGVKSIKLPDNTSTSSDNASYTVAKAGTYSFVVTDNAGNIYTATVTVSDVTAPTVTVDDADGRWRNSNPAVTVTATDSESGIKSIEYQVATSPVEPVSGWLAYSSAVVIPDGQHYLWTRVTDHADNVTINVFGPYKIDRFAPVITVAAVFTEAGARVDVSATDNDSGMKSWTLPDNSEVVGSKTAFTFTEAIGHFKATDHAGNTAIVSELMVAEAVVTQLEALNTAATETNIAVTRNIVQALADGAEKIALTDRIDRVRLAVDNANGVSAATDAVVDAENASRTIVTLDQVATARGKYDAATSLVTALPAVAEKERLAARLATVKQKIDQAELDLQAASSSAQAAVAAAKQVVMDTSVPHEDAVARLDEATALTEGITDPVEKAALEAEIAPLQQVVQAEAATITAQTAVNSLTKDESKVSAESVADSHAQIANAQAMVDALPSSAKKSQLSDRLASSEQEMKTVDAILKVLEAETLVVQLQPSQANIDALTAKYNEANALVQKLPAGNSRTALQDRLNAVQTKISEMTAKVRVGEAETAIVSTNMVWIKIDEAQTVLNKASQAVAKLPAGEVKTDLTVRINDAQAAINSARAQIKVNIAEGLLVQGDINAAWPYVNLLQTGAEKTSLTERLNLTQAVADAVVMVTKAETSYNTMITGLMATPLTTSVNLATVQSLYQTAQADAVQATAQATSLIAPNQSPLASRISDMKTRTTNLNRMLPTVEKIFTEAQDNIARGNGYDVNRLRMILGGSANLKTQFDAAIKARLGSTDGLTWKTSDTSLVVLSSSGSVTAAKTGVAKVTVSNQNGSMTIYLVITLTR